MQIATSLASVDETVIAQELIHEILSTAPRSLTQLNAELLIIRDGVYLFHYRDPITNAEQFKPVSPETLQIAFSNRTIDSGWLDSSIVRWGRSSYGQFVVQWIAPQRVTIRIESETLSVPMPGLVWIAQRSTYWIIATRTKSFDPTAPAFHAPVANVHPTLHQVCWGNITPPEASPDRMNQAWQHFTTSQFNQDWSNGKSIEFPHNVNLKLRSLMTAKRYPLKDLTPIRDSPYPNAPTQSIESVINALIQ